MGNLVCFPELFGGRLDKYVINKALDPTVACKGKVFFLAQGAACVWILTESFLCNSHLCYIAGCMRTFPHSLGWHRGMQGESNNALFHMHKLGLNQKQIVREATFCIMQVNQG